MPPQPGEFRSLRATGYGEDVTVKFFRRISIRAPKPYDLKRESTVDAWLARVLFQMCVLTTPNDKRTKSLILLFDTDSFDTARYLGIQKRPTFTLHKKA